MYANVITFWDWLLLPFYFLLIFIIASYIKSKNKGNPIFKYFIPALFAKIVGAISLCLIYVYYYKMGGDTLNYNADSSVLLKLLYYSPSDFFEVWLSPLSEETFSYFTSDIGYLVYWHDPNAFMVDRLLVPVKFISFDSYLVSSVIMAAISFTGVWKLYTVFCDSYPFLYKHFAITVLFIPSVLFWGSGLLKDSWTLGAAGWFCYSFYSILIKKKSLIASSLTLIISSILLILIKPYIYLGLLPGIILWMTWSRLNKIKNTLLKIVVAPIIIILGIGIGFLVWSLTSSNLGEYSSMDRILNKAVESSYDLKQDYYQGNSFDLGNFDASITGMLAKFPIASVTGLFRPFFWEARNIVMLASGLENIIILFFVLYIFFRKPWVAISSTLSNPLVLFCLIFSVFFAFSVAISTSNFGALVRLRIPMMPFFLSGLVLIEYTGDLSKSFMETVKIKS